MRRRWKVIIIVFTLIAMLFLLLIGPWPTYRSSFEGRGYYRQSLRAIAEASRQLHFSSTPKTLQFGFGEAEITPSVGTPLAGYGSRKGAASISERTSFFPPRTHIPGQEHGGVPFSRKCMPAITMKRYSTCWRSVTSKPS